MTQCFQIRQISFAAGGNLVSYQLCSADDKSCWSPSAAPSYSELLTVKIFSIMMSSLRLQTELVRDLPHGTNTERDVLIQIDPQFLSTLQNVITVDGSGKSFVFHLLSY
jgi:hypothetical protein